MSQEVLNKKLKVFRLLKGLTQADLAAKIGISQRAVSHWELGANGISEEHWQALIKIFPELRGIDNE
jgi:transcriptional regulator with XRE-family HTH domain